MRLKPELKGLRVAGRRVLVLLGCLVLPAAIFAAYFTIAFQVPPRLGEPAFGWDFRATWEAAGHILDGESPYPAPVAAALAREDQFVYPPVAGVAMVPLRLFGAETAAVVFALIVLAAAAGTLRVLGVRDWRCYGVVAMWIPVLESIRLGTISVLLAFGAAAAWRYRGSWKISAAAVGAVVAAKLFLWPLVIWLALTGRLRHAVASVAVATTATLASWGLIGFAGLSAYPTLLERLTEIVAWKSYSLYAFGLALDLSPDKAQVLIFSAGAAAIAATFLVARRGGADADRQAFIAAIGAAFILSPIVWTHYFALLLVPLGIARPRLGPLWFVPLAFWFSPVQSAGELWRIGLGLSVALLVLVGAALTARAFRRELWLAPRTAGVAR